MSKPVTILKGCLGLNTRDHPSELGAHLTKAVNVDITDVGSVSRRDGYSVVTGSLTNAHSLVGFLDRYAIYADGANLYSYDSVSGTATTVFSALTANKPLCYAPVGEALAFTNGVERGRVVVGASGIECIDYWDEQDFPDALDAVTKIAAFPVTDLIHWFNGSMYGTSRGETFLYTSIAYTPNNYDSNSGYILMSSATKWISSVNTALLIGTDAGVVAYAGHNMQDFTEKTITSRATIACSGKVHVTFPSDSPYQGQHEGVLVMTDEGVVFISDQLEVADMTSKVKLNWGKLSSGCFGVIDNSYIFSGGTT